VWPSGFEAAEASGGGRADTAHLPRWLPGDRMFQRRNRSDPVVGAVMAINSRKRRIAFPLGAMPSDRCLGGYQLLYSDMN
jgi:hypothetical protein